MIYFSWKEVKITVLNCLKGTKRIEVYIGTLLTV